MLEVDALYLTAGMFKLEDVSFSVEEGQYLVLMGRTGSGKSLLVQSIAGLVKIDRGQITLNDRDITNLEPRFRNIGYVPQDSGLFPHLNVKKNILFPLRVRRLPYGDFEPVVDSIGIGHLLDRSVQHLSGGERQKVALARALVYKPSLLLLDEPLSALDEPSRNEIASTLKNVQNNFNVATIHVCHNSSEARDLADMAGIMTDGHLVKIDSMENLDNGHSILA